MAHGAVVALCGADRGEARLVAESSDPVAAVVAQTADALIRPRRRVEIQDHVLGGVKGEWVRSARPANAAQSAAILYLHGGGYCVGSPAMYRAVTARLARATGLPVFVADYRLAPEHPFPAAVDDAVAAYRALLEMGPVVVAGDSAGGGLALATALAARQLQLSPPAALILLSPWVDLTTSMLSDKAARHEAVLSRAWLAACARHYLAGGDPKAPLASPIYGDLHGLPPTLIQAGADELLHSDAVRVHDALTNAGVAVRCEIVCRALAWLSPSRRHAAGRQCGHRAGWALYLVQHRAAGSRPGSLKSL